MNNFSIIILTCFLIGCSSKEKLISEYYSEDNNVNLQAFVGKKISVTYFNPNDEQIENEITDTITGEKIIRKSYVMDLGFRCKYLVLKNVFNSFEKDTI